LCTFTIVAEVVIAHPFFNCRIFERIINNLDEKKNNLRKLARKENLATINDSFVKRYEHLRQIN